MWSSYLAGLAGIQDGCLVVTMLSELGGRSETSVGGTLGFGGTQSTGEGKCEYRGGWKIPVGCWGQAGMVYIPEGWDDHGGGPSVHGGGSSEYGGGASLYLVPVVIHAQVPGGLKVMEV